MGSAQSTENLPYNEWQLEPNKLPIFYHPKSNISFAGFEKLHPFDSKKYGRTVAELTTTHKLQCHTTTVRT